MPDPQFAWTSVNDTVASVNTGTGLVSGLQIGFTHVHVYNVRLPENRVTGVVHVAEPGALELEAVPTGGVKSSATFALPILSVCCRPLCSLCVSVGPLGCAQTSVYLLFLRKHPWLAQLCATH